MVNVTMILIISGTNRPKSESLNVSELTLQFLKSKTDQEIQLLDLSAIPYDWIHSDMFQKSSVAPSLLEIIDHQLRPANKWLFVTPEYNGSYPGILKLFLDACSVTPFKNEIYPRKAGLIGVASGRAGNLRGMEHLTGVLNYLGFVLYPDKLPISSIKSLQDQNGTITDPATLMTLDKFLSSFLEF
jgi:chromate reductase, NAD(P)H dehydrogenase (quinone)